MERSTFDERAFVARVEAAGVEELARLLAYPTSEEETALRVYLGDARYQRMHYLALRQSTRGVRTRQGNVVVIPGIMGSELTAVDGRGGHEQIWVKALPILAGRLSRLRLAADGRGEFDPRYDVRATGILKRFYGELLLALNEQWRVRAFWFDWRKDLNLAADELRAQLSGWFADDEPVHIVAHSMGGLVARTFIKNHPERWQTMWDGQANGRRGGRLVMLGTPHHGSFAIPQAILGLEGAVRKLALADLRHNAEDLLRILNSFVGSYQMLPSPLLVAAAEPLYLAATYGGELDVPQRHLDTARAHHQALHDAARTVDPARMIVVAGANRPTLGAIRDLARLASLDAYELTLAGDGRVSHELGALGAAAGAADGSRVPTYYVDEGHGDLPANRAILSALDALLAEGAAQLETEPPRQRLTSKDEATLRRRLVEDQQAEEDRLDELVRRTQSRRAWSGAAGAGGRGTPPPGERSWAADGRAAVVVDDGVERPAPRFVSADEREIEEVLTEEVLGRGRLAAGDGRPGSAPPAPPIEIGLALDGIEHAHLYGDAETPVDAIAAGHYLGVRPQAAELALDRALSAALRDPVSADAPPLARTDLLITQFTERGTLLGGLGQPFLLPDLRPGNGEAGAAVDRVVVLAGMGVPGRFGAPELTVLARELCWALGRLGKRHLATVVIGTGNGNLSIRDAIGGWLAGIETALAVAPGDDQRRLRRITFVNHDPTKLRAIQEAIREEAAYLRSRQRLDVAFVEIPEERLRELETQPRRPDDAAEAADPEDADRVPTRITLGMERETYRFGAITEGASIPEREVPIDPRLVMRANDELAAEADPAMQFERGLFLERLLIPEDLRSQLVTDAPVVMMLDATTARIHWEMVAQADPATTLWDAFDRTGDDAAARRFDPKRFLGTSRGFTRQLRTTFAPPPEPPPPARRALRVLVVADPAEDAHLPGAEEEGIEVADLFAAFNRVYAGSTENRVEVGALLGPRQATRTNVLRHLMLRPVDVLHFAGHCFFDREHPVASGWIFSNGETLSARELARADRVPKFVVSNACESGITPDRAEQRTTELAPSFAEAFFARGVGNFVCTAWPVDDTAARRFALRLYASLLGLDVATDGAGQRYGPTAPQPMHVAMRQARLSIAEPPFESRTWGAYQHYGSPYFRLFDPRTMGRSDLVAAPTEATPPARAAGDRPAATGRRRAKDGDDERANEPGG